MTSEKEDKAHVVAFAFPFGSHPTPLLHLVQRLAAAAPGVDFSFFNTAESNRRVLPGADLDKYGNVKAYDVSDGAPEGHVFSGNPLERVELFVGVIPGNFRRRLEEAVVERGSRATCLLTDAFLWFSADVAAELGVPWVAFWTAGTAALSVHLHTDLIRDKLGTNTQTKDDQVLDFIPGLSTIHASDLPQEVLNPDTAFSCLLHSMSLVLPHAAAIVLNSFDVIDPDVEHDLTPKLRRLLLVGPFPLLLPPPQQSATNDCLAWLAHQAAASVAYISFGTMLTLPPPELLALAEALEEGQVPYVWSIRGDSRREVLEPFIEKTGSLGKVVRWAPQREVLEHPSVGAFVTHCGWNSVVEAVAGGVPMVCRPFFGDQMINRRRVTETWRIGVGVEGGVFTSVGVLRALEVVLTGKEGKEMRGNIERLKEKGMRAVAEGGSSTENFKSLVAMVTASYPR